MKYAYIITITIILILQATLVASDRFSKATEEDAVWIRTCFDACRNFRAYFQKFTNNTNINNWVEARQAFTTCQWRCYRCSLQSGVAGMEAIESVSSDLQGTQAQDIIKKYKRDINLSAFICRDKWIMSSELGCTRNPVETVDLNCRS